MENAHLNAQVIAMAQELSQKSEEIRKFHAEQAVVFSGSESWSDNRPRSPTNPGCTTSWWDLEIQSPPDRLFPSS